MKKALVTMMAISAVASVLTGCSPSVTKKVSEKSETLNLKVVKIIPPKHMRIVLRDEKGNLYQYGSKYCGTYKSYKVGSVYKIEAITETYELDNGKTREHQWYAICAKAGELAEKQF